MEFPLDGRRCPECGWDPARASRARIEKASRRNAGELYTEGFIPAIHRSAMGGGVKAGIGLVVVGILWFIALLATGRFGLGPLILGGIGGVVIGDSLTRNRLAKNRAEREARRRRERGDEPEERPRRRS
jgi:hypothetical protein